MGLFFRKRVKLFKGINLNLSKSGFGLSFGLKGLRISTNKDGTTLNAGRNGLYFRKKISDNESDSACCETESEEIQNESNVAEPIQQIEQSERNFNNKFVLSLLLMIFSLILMFVNLIFIFAFAASIIFLIRLQINKSKIIDSDKQARIERQRKSKYQDYNYSYRTMETKNNDK